MTPYIRQQPFQDIEQYPPHLLHILDDCIHIPVTYKKIWDDDFAAKGWKVNATIGDPAIIASTCETGLKINTSVFVHDILDHFLSGFGVSGHRSEAMALIQLSKRTGSDPAPDFEQIIKEDILNGSVNGEKLTAFLPENLCSLLPTLTTISDKEIISKLKDLLGEKKLIKILIEHFFSMGKTGEKHAANSWKKLGLNINKQTELGLALQNLLEKMDALVEKKTSKIMEGFIKINNEHTENMSPLDGHCTLEITEPAGLVFFAT